MLWAYQYRLTAGRRSVMRCRSFGWSDNLQGQMSSSEAGFQLSSDRDYWRDGQGKLYLTYEGQAGPHKQRMRFPKDGNGPVYRFHSDSGARPAKASWQQFDVVTTKVPRWYSALLIKGVIDKLKPRQPK